MQIDVSCPHTKHRFGDIGYMFVILEHIAITIIFTHIYIYVTYQAYLLSTAVLCVYYVPYTVIPQ